MSGCDLSNFARDDVAWVPLDQVAVRVGFAVNREEDPSGQFKLANDTLDGWLPSARAGQMHDEGQILTIVALHGDRPVGFIATHTYALHDDHQGAKSLSFVKPYSALKILHLAVDKNYPRLGIASDLLSAFGIGCAATLNLFTGCRFVYLDALKPAVPFYRRKSFIELPTKKPNEWSTPMLFDLAASPTQFAEFRRLGEAYLQGGATASLE